MSYYDTVCAADILHILEHSRTLELPDTHNYEDELTGKASQVWKREPQ